MNELNKFIPPFRKLSNDENVSTNAFCNLPMFSCTIGNCKKASSHPFNITQQDCIAFPNALMPFSIYSLRRMKSRNPEIRSPNVAVTSKISKSNDCKIRDRPLNANFNPPPVMVVMISIIANKPLKVLVILSAFSSVICKCSVKLWIACIRLYIALERCLIISSSVIP